MTHYDLGNELTKNVAFLQGKVDDAVDQSSKDFWAPLLTTARTRLQRYLDGLNQEEKES